MVVEQMIPVLRVVDVSRSMQWYGDVLGLVGDPFPAEPPFAFAILRGRGAELMLQLGQPTARTDRRPYAWDVYVRYAGSQFRELFRECQQKNWVSRALERMPYGLAEFELVDPDGYILCLSQWLADADDLPTPVA